MRSFVWRPLARRIAALRRRQDGNVLILTASLLPFMIGGAGLGIDAVLWMSLKRQLQAAADAGALAAASAHAQGYPYETAAQRDIAKNTTFGGVSATVHNPPQEGSFAGDTTAFEAKLTGQGALAFSRMFLQANPVVTARAVARAEALGNGCILSLSRTEARAVEFTGSSSVSLGCGIASNSRASDAISIGGSAKVSVPFATAVGGISVSSTATLSTSLIKRTFGTPQPDPFGPQGRNIQMPTSPSSCTQNNLQVGSGTVVLSPGRYCGGIKITGATVTFSPGTYIIDGGSFAASSSSILKGQGVTFFLTGSGTNYATLDITGGAAVALTAPTTDSGSPYAGILFFQDRNAPELKSPNSNKLLGNTAMALQGILYFPRQPVNISGGASGNTNCLQIVGRIVQVSGGAVISNTCPANAGVNQTKTVQVTLVE